MFGSQISVLFDMRVMRWSDADDAALLAASRAEPDAFMVFHRRYESAVIGYLLRRTGNTELAVDLTSEGFAEALASSRRYQPEKDSAAAWLFTIAHHVLTDSLRRGRVDARARRRLGIGDAIAYSDDDLERIESLVSRSGWATRLLEALPEEQRSALHARIVEKRSYTDIARELKTSEPVVRKRVSRGLSALRAHTKELP
jgi:RNA polymerase sigma factor (sigma-70 family)